MALESNQLRTRAPTARFQRGAFPVGQPSLEESGEIESHAVRRALVSSEARSLIGSLSILGYQLPSPGQFAFDHW